MELEHTAQVWGITGNLGGGKTLTAVEIAIRAMSVGYGVVTNIVLDIDRISRDFGDHCRRLYFPVDMDTTDPDSWPTGDLRGSGGRRRVLVVLDEVSEWFDQYSSTSSTVKHFMSWLRHSSKRGQDVFLVTQRRAYLAKSLRLLIARWVWVEDLAVWRIPALRIRVPFMRGYVIRCIQDRESKVIQPLELTRKKVWGRYYNTAQILKGSLALPYEAVHIQRPEPLSPIAVSAWLVVVGYLLLHW